MKPQVNPFAIVPAQIENVLKENKYKLSKSEGLTCLNPRVVDSDSTTLWIRIHGQEKLRKKCTFP
jgi:hypothetical protein